MVILLGYIPSPNPYIFSPKSYPVPIVYHGLSITLYMVNTVFVPPIHTIDTKYSDN